MRGRRRREPTEPAAGHAEEGHVAAEAVRAGVAEDVEQQGAAGHDGDLHDGSGWYEGGGLD